MSTPDTVSISSALDSKSEVLGNDEEFSSSEWLYLNDMQGGTTSTGAYNSGQIKFDTLIPRNQWVIWADSYLLLNIAVSSASGAKPYEDTTPIAFKQSACDLITGLLVTTGGGQTIINDTYIQQINRVRMLTQTGLSGAYSNMQDLGFWKDTSTMAALVTPNTKNPVPGGNTTGSSYGINTQYAQADLAQLIYTDTGSSGAGIVIKGENPYYNEGFKIRSQLFKTMVTSFNNGTFNLQVKIPLALIHPFFAALNFPVINTHFLFTFFTSIGTGNVITSQSPFLVPQLSQESAPRPFVDLPQCAITSTTQLFYRKITYSPELNKKIVAKLNAGYTKTLLFPTVDQYIKNVGTTPDNVTTRIDLVSPATVAPLRVYALLVPTTATDSSTVPFICPGILTNINLNINNEPYYSSSLLTNRQIWSVVEENSVSHGVSNVVSSMIGFGDFLSNYRIHLCDVSRVKGRLNPTEACSLQFVSTKADMSGVSNPATNFPSNVDFLYLVEKQCIIKMNFSLGDVKILVAAADA